jgi:hypothetical protein
VTFTFPVRSSAQRLAQPDQSTKATMVAPPASASKRFTQLTFDPAGSARPLP